MSLHSYIISEFLQNNIRFLRLKHFPMPGRRRYAC